jgi:hypothetical protein
MKDFVFWGNWFEKEYPMGSDRFWSFKIALNLFLQNKGTNIVETGTVNEGDFGAGASTIFFGKFLHKYGGRLWTVDLSEEAIAECKIKTSDYKDNITYVCEDSVTFLDNFLGPIDLLYLDSMDYPLTAEEGTIEDCQRHQLKEIETAYSKVVPGGIILLDDNTLPGGGKTKLAKEFLEKQGATCIMDFQGSLWIK